MTVVDVKRIVIGFLESEREGVVSTLKRLGTVHIDDMFLLLKQEQEPGNGGGEGAGQTGDVEMPGTRNSTEELGYQALGLPSDSHGHEQNLGQLASALKNMSSYIGQKSFVAELVEGIIFSTFNIHPLISKKKYKETVADRNDLLVKAKEINSLAKKIKSIDATIRSLKERQKTFRRLSHIDIPLQLLQDTGRTRVRTGSLGQKSYQAMSAGFGKASEHPRVVMAVAPEKKVVDVVVLYLKEDEEAAEKLESFGFRDIMLPDGSDTPGQEADRVQKEVKKAEKELELAKKKMESYASCHLGFLALFDYFSNRKSEYAICDQFLGTERTVFILGWLLTEDLDRTISKLELVSPSVDFVIQDPAEGDKVPTKIRPGPLSSSFGFITRMYGSPKWGDMDPTPFFAPFFVVFLGMCLSDAGYGIVLLLLSIYAERTLRGGKNFFRVLIWGSIVTIIVGAFIGSWFGADLEADISSWPGFMISLREGLRSMQAMNITEGDGLILFLIFALILGVIQVFTGLGVKMYWNIKIGKVKDAIFDQGFWIIFLLGFLGLILSSDMGMGSLAEPLPLLSQALFWGGMALLILTQGRRQKNPVVKLIGGFLSLYNITGYFSDTLSYSRLLALGLATGLIAFIINLLAFMLYAGLAGIPVIGLFIAIPVVIIFLVVAHLGNLALSLLGAIIHTLRLQYIEYFTKFYEGGGRSFSPFREVMKKVDIDRGA